MIFLLPVPAKWISRRRGGTMKLWKVLTATMTMVGGQEKISNSIYFIMAKAVTFWPWWQPFNSFCFEGLYFFLCFSFFFLLLKKEWGGGGGEHGPPASLLGVAGPVYSGWLWILYSLKVIPVQINQRNSTIELSSSFQAEIRQGRVAFYLGRVVFYLSTALCEWH